MWTRKAFCSEIWWSAIAPGCVSWMSTLNGAVDASEAAREQEEVAPKAQQAQVDSPAA